MWSWAGEGSRLMGLSNELIGMIGEGDTLTTATLQGPLKVGRIEILATELPD